MIEPKKILLSINTTWNIYNFRAGLISHLKQQGHTVVTAAPDDAFSPRLKMLVDEHIHIPMQNAGTSLLEDGLLFLRYLQLLKKVKPDIFLTYTIKPNIYGAFAARVLGIPILVNISGLGTAFIHNNWLTALVKRLYKLSLQHAPCVFFQNVEDQALFLHMGLVRPEQATLLPGSGVNLEYFHPRFAQKRADTTLPTSFVLIARLLWDKGIGEYIQAAQIIKETHPEVIFRIVGPKDVLNKTAISDAHILEWERTKVVEYIGETEDVRNVLALHDCVVLPSYREGMSRVLLEAAAMGKPLIASDVPGCKHVVEHGKNGFLCTVKNAESLAESLRLFLALSTAERNAMGRASRLKAEQEFDEQRVFQTYSDKIAAFTAR